MLPILGAEGLVQLLLVGTQWPQVVPSLGHATDNLARSLFGSSRISQECRPKNRDTAAFSSQIYPLGREKNPPEHPLTMTAKDIGSLLPLFPPSPSSVPRSSLHRLRMAWCSPPESTPHSSHLASRLFFPTGSKSELGPRGWDQDVSVCRRFKLILDLPSTLQPADNKENAVGRVSLLDLPINVDLQSSHFSHVIRCRQERDASQRRGDA
jgi:hypothetical protein